MILLPLLAAASLTAPIDGTWAVNRKQCAVDQGLAGAPTQIARGRLDQHEAHCTLKTFTRVGVGRWVAKGACEVEGNQQRAAYRFQRRGDTLVIHDADSRRPQVLRACVPARPGTN